MILWSSPLTFSPAIAYEVLRCTSAYRSGHNKREPGSTSLLAIQVPVSPTSTTPSLLHSLAALIVIDGMAPFQSHSVQQSGACQGNPRQNCLSPHSDFRYHFLRGHNLWHAVINCSDGPKVVAET